MFDCSSIMRLCVVITVSILALDMEMRLAWQAESFFSVTNAMNGMAWDELLFLCVLLCLGI